MTEQAASILSRKIRSIQLEIENLRDIYEIENFSWQRTCETRGSNITLAQNKRAMLKSYYTAVFSGILYTNRKAA